MSQTPLCNPWGWQVEAKLPILIKLKVPGELKSEEDINNDENDNDAEDPNDDGYLPLIGDQLIVPDDGDDPLGPDDIGILHSSLQMKVIPQI